MELVLTVFVAVALIIVLISMAAIATLILHGVYEELKR